MATPRRLSLAAPGPMAPVPFRVARRRRETRDTWTLELEPVAGEPLRPQPGQFTMLYAFGIGEVPISVSGAAGGPLVHTVRAVGAVTQAICASQPGRRARRARPVRQRVAGRGRGRRATSSSSPAGSGSRRCGRPSTSSSRRRARLRRGRAPLRQPDARRPALPRASSSGCAGGSTSRSTSPSTPPTAAGGARSASCRSSSPARASIRPSAVALVCGPEIMMRFAARALLERGVPRRADLPLDGAQHAAAGSATAATASSARR